MENFIAQTVKNGIIQESHLKDVQNGTMTTDQLNRENEDQQSLFSRAGLFFCTCLDGIVYVIYLHQ